MPPTIQWRSSGRGRAVAILTIVLLALCAPAFSAQRCVRSLGKPYAYFKTVPGHDPGDSFYEDDPHIVHTSGLRSYSAGDLTDGAVGDGVSDGSIPSPVVAIGGSQSTPPPAGTIIFDLEAVFTNMEIVIGTSLKGVNGSFGGWAPDDVDIKFSTTGTDKTDFGPATHFDLWSPTETLGLGHHEKILDVSGASAWAP